MLQYLLLYKGVTQQSMIVAMQMKNNYSFYRFLNILIPKIHFT